MSIQTIADRWRDVAFEARALVYHGSLDEPAIVALSDVHNASYIAELTISPVGSELPLLRLDEPIDAERELLALLVEAPADIKALLAEVGQLRTALKGMCTAVDTLSSAEIRLSEAEDECDPDAADPEPILLALAEAAGDAWVATYAARREAHALLEGSNDRA